MASSVQLAGSDPALVAAVRRARKLLNRGAMAGAASRRGAAAAVDWLADAALLSGSYVPLAGRALSPLIGYSAIRVLCGRTSGSPSRYASGHLQRLRAG